MKIVAAISGASGVNLGLKLALQIAKRSDAYVVISRGAKEVLLKERIIEDEKNLSALKALEKVAKIHSDDDLAAPISSGSFGIDATIIAPCSINTLAKIHAGFADTLITRAAAVALKERKRLVLGVREMPFSTLALEHAAKLSALGAVIAPPVFGYYSGQNSLEDMENFIIGKWLDLLGLEHQIYKRWS